MSNELVQRLRAFKVWNNWQSHYEPVPLCQEAADALERSSERVAVTPEMIERGAKALHVVSTYRGYDKETLDREFVRMEGIYRAHVTAVLNAALVSSPVTEKTDG